MPDQDAKIRLTVEDNTAPALKTAAANIKKVTDQLAKAYAPATKAGADWARAAESSAKRLGTSLEDVARRQSLFGIQTKDNTKHIEKLGSSGSAAFGLMTKGVEGGNAALMAMAGRYLGVAAAAEVARKSFLGFAATDQRMRLLQNDAGATRKEIDRTTESLKKLSIETATSMDPLIEGFNELREAGQLSLQETEKIFPKIAKAAKGSGMDVVALGRSVGDMMRNMQVPAEGVDKALEAITFGVQDLRMNADAFSKAAPKLTEAMAEWGYKGTDGVERMVAFMGSLQKVTGDTTKSSMVLGRILETMSSSEMSTALGFETAEGLQKHLRGAQAAGEDVLGVYVGLIANAKDRDAVLNKIGLRERASVRALLNDYDKMNGRIKEISNSHGRAAAAFKNVMEGPQASIDQMILSLEALGKEFGLLLHTLGVTEGIKALIEEFKELRRLVLAIKEIWEGFKKGALPDWADEAISDKLFGKIGEGGIRDMLEGLAYQMGRETKAHKRMREDPLGERHKGYETPGPMFPGEKEKADADRKSLEDALKTAGPEIQKQAEEQRQKIQQENQLRELGTQRLRELNEELQKTTGNIKKMSYNVDKGGDKVRIFAARLDEGSNELGGMIHNATYTSGGGGGGGGGGQSAGPSGGYGGGTGYGGGNRMGVSPNAPASGTGNTTNNAPAEAAPAATTSDQGVAMQPGTSAPVLPQELGGPAPGAAAAPAAGAGAGAGGGGLSKDAYENMFKGTPLAGKYDKVVAEANKNGVPPATMAAIMAHETGKGTSKMLRERNNPAGLMDPKTKHQTGMSFENIDQGIESAGRNIAKNYKRAGGDIDKMAEIYAPRGAKNDPGGLNRHWPAGIKKYTEQLGGGAAASSATAGNNATPKATQIANASASGTIPGTSNGMNQSIDSAMKMVGLNETRDQEVLKQYMKTGGRGLSGEQNAWCAQFVNGIVRQAGGTGTNSWAAKSFLKWGRGVGADEKLMKGDVFVFHRGRDPAKGHVGAFTGETRVNSRGETEYQMIQGNTGGARAGGGQVGLTWHTRAGITAGIRRGNIAPGDVPENVAKTTAPPPKIAATQAMPPVQPTDDVKEPRQRVVSPDTQNANAKKKDEEITELARGGTMRPGQTALVGEEGPELFQAGNSGRVYPNSSLSVNMRVNDAHVQFAKASMRRQADREVREARWGSYSDIGAA